MELSPLAMTSITNFLLSSETFFLTGLLFARHKSPGSASYSWQLVMLFLAIAALIGGIDHGFFEIQGDSLAREIMKYITWIFLGIVTFLLALTIIKQYSQQSHHKILYLLALIQLIVNILLIFIVNNFLIVLVNYAPLMILMLIFNFINLKKGSGSWSMIIGILIGFIASGIQAAGIDIFTPINRDSLYHIGMMISVIFFYKAGLLLKTENPYRK
ncbi:MAG: hypothetical protein JXJ04_22810 [Spirochaetales bacterium]|nr:hypothetical protein [Spirochaetales bacterium]